MEEPAGASFSTSLVQFVALNERENLKKKAGERVADSDVPVA